MKFDIIIMNPPYDKNKIYYRVIKSVKKIAKRMVVIIPSREGDIFLSQFNYVNCNMRLKIYKLKINEPLKYETWTKFTQSEFYIHVPKWSMGIKKFYETGDYVYIKKNKKNEEYYTFSFYTQEDLEKFKERLFIKESKNILKGGSITPNYDFILEGINYIKKYREI